MMLSFFFFLVSACTLLTAPLSAVTGNFSPKDPKHKNLTKRLVIPHEKYTLDNGLTVILSVDKTTPMVATSIWYKVGANNEQAGKTGLAHLFEHLMFEGSKHVKDDQHFKLLDSSGAFALNATTNFDRTNYYVTVPKNQLELVLALESSRMSFLEINKTKLDEQAKVVANERRQRFEISPYGLATLKLWQSVFPETHPMHGLVIGSHRDIENATVNDVQSFYDQYYGPSNASLAIVGDIDLKQTKAWVQKYFASLPKTAGITKPVLPQIHLGPQEIIRFPEKLARLPLIRVQYLTPALFKNGDADLDILSHILSGGENARLVKALTRDQKIASAASAVQQSFEQVSVFNIDAILNPGVKPSSALKAIDDVLLGLVLNPPSKREINRARNYILTQHFFGLQELGGGQGRAEALQSYNRYAGDPNYIQKDLARYKAVNQKSIIETVKKYLPIGKNRKILEAIPEHNNAAQAADQKDQ
jgi:predicted Zn-dependent peptidase